MSSGDPLYNVLLLGVGALVIGLIVGEIKWLSTKVSSKAKVRDVASQGWSHGNATQGAENLNFIFKSSYAAFEHICRYMDCELAVGKTLPALVESARGKFGTMTDVKRREDGVQIAILKVPSRDGGFLVFSETVSNSALDLHVGDLVAWHIGAYNSKIGAQVGDDERIGWLGFIVGRLKPELERRDGEWRWKGDETFE